MSYRIIVVTLLVALLALGATGCQRAVDRAVERTIEESTGIRIDEDEDRVTITGGDGEEYTMEGDGSSLPDDWPADVPVYPDMRIESSTTMRMGDDVQFVVSATTSDDVSDVYEWYRDELPDAGWEITGDFSIEQNGERTANISSSKDGSDANVFIGDQDGATGISIQVRTQ